MRDLIVKCVSTPQADSLKFVNCGSGEVEVWFRREDDISPFLGSILLNPAKARAIIAWLERALAEPESDEPEVV